MDSFGNLIVHPEVGLMVLIPGKGDTLRVGGTGRIVRNASLRERLAMVGREPNLVLVVDVREAFLHCRTSILRSHLWQPEHWPNASDVPTLAETMVTHGRLEETVPEMQAIIDDDRKTRLYRGSNTALGLAGRGPVGAPDGAGRRLGLRPSGSAAGSWAARIAARRQGGTATVEPLDRWGFGGVATCRWCRAGGSPPRHDREVVRLSDLRA